MIIRKLRLQRGWSQDQLAQFSGLSVRTIQRIERGQNAGLDSLKSLAAVFDVHVSELQQETDMAEEIKLNYDENHAIEYVRDLKAFYSSVLSYVLIIPMLFILNFMTSPHYIWAWWPMFGWGFGLIVHGLSVFEVFNLFGPDWEKRQIEKRIGKKL